MALFLYVISILISTAACRCISGNRGGVEVIYHGESCDCARPIPYQVEVPILQRENYIPRDYGYNVEVPIKPVAQVRYAFDVEVEKPIEGIEEYSLGSVGYQIEVPDKIKEDTRYIFDYKVEVPVEERKCEKFGDLFTQVDRVVLPRRDCQTKSCTCRGLNPTPGIFRNCPKHGHLYSRREFGPIVPIRYRNRYVQFEPKTYSETDSVESIAGRQKRQVIESNDVLSSFIKTTDTIMSSLRPTVVSIASTIQTILNKSENEEHYITKREADADEEAAKVEVVKPELIEDNVAMSSENEFVTVNRDDDNAPHAADKFDGIKYSCPTVANLKVNGNPDLLDRAEVLQYLPEVSDSEPFERKRKDCQSCGAKDTTHYPCPKCGYIESAYNYPGESQFYELTDGMPVAYTPGQLTARSDNSQAGKIRPVYDRLGHRYVENPETGNLRLMSPKSANEDYAYGGPPLPPPPPPPHNPYNELHHILDNYRGFLHDINSHSAATGLTDSPVTIILDAIKFMRDATLGGEDGDTEDSTAYHARNANNKEYELSDLNAYGMQNGKMPFYPTDMMYSPSEKSESAANTGGPVKRSFKFTPISQDEEDGSVLVRISPTKATQEKLKQFGMMPAAMKNSYKSMSYDDNDMTSSFKQRKAASATSAIPSILSGKNSGRNLKKITRNGKEYEFVTLDNDYYSGLYNSDNSEEYTTAADKLNFDDEDDNAELLKYIYRAQQATAGNNGQRRNDKTRFASHLNEDDFTIEDYDV